eukprot:gene1134-biopygen969
MITIAAAGGKAPARRDGMPPRDALSCACQAGVGDAHQAGRDSAVVMCVGDSAVPLPPALAPSPPRGARGGDTRPTCGGTTGLGSSASPFVPSGRRGCGLLGHRGCDPLGH